MQAINKEFFDLRFKTMTENPNQLQPDTPSGKHGPKLIIALLVLVAILVAAIIYNNASESEDNSQSSAQNLNPDVEESVLDDPSKRYRVELLTDCPESTTLLTNENVEGFCGLTDVDECDDNAIESTLQENEKYSCYLSKAPRQYLTSDQLAELPSSFDTQQQCLDYLSNQLIIGNYYSELETCMFVTDGDFNFQIRPVTAS